MKDRKSCYARYAALKWQIATAILISFMLIPVSGFAQVTVPQDVKNEMLESDTGTAHIVVGLNVQEGELISEIQDRFLNEINEALASQGRSVTAEKKFNEIPYIIIEVDSSTIQPVKSNALVKSIQLYRDNRDISVDPTAFDFGDIALESSSSPKVFTITNRGSAFADLEISSVSLTGLTHF